MEILKQILLFIEDLFSTEKTKDLNIDCPDKRDFLYNDLFGGEPAKRKGTVPKNLIFWNQRADKRTYMGCSRYGITHISNIQNINEFKKHKIAYRQIDPKVKWLDYLKVNPQAQWEGATLQSVLKQFKDDGLIEGWTKVRGKEELKKAIDNRRYILTGSMDGDWKSVKETGFYKQRKDKKNVGHIFCIVDYVDDDEHKTKGFACINSKGPKGTPKNGFFIIPFELVDTLYTRYAISDRNDEEVIRNYKLKKDQH